jgi:endonuclease VIII
VPEGDTIFRAARTLHRALAGREVVRFESVFPALTRVHDDSPITGRRIEDVTAAGKHILMRFSAMPRAAAGAPNPPATSKGGELVLRTHMKMNGSWHIYRTGEAWQRPRRDMRLRVATDEFEAVGFNVPVAEFLDVRALARQDDLRLMGPDLLADTFDAHDALHRFRARPQLSIADALLNQRIVAGVGNVYKSEVLFLCGINPFATVAQVDDDGVLAILATARKHLKANVIDPTAAIVTYRGFRRTTRRADPAERLYVYGRAGKPCRKCGTPIEVRAQGTNARLTYWCGRCQAPP